MAKLSKTKLYAIHHLHNQKMEPQQIGKELKISIDDVNKAIQSFSVDTQKKVSSVKDDKTKDLMIRQTSVKKTNSVSVMTEPASQVSDEFVKNFSPPSRIEKHIFRPKN